MLVLCHISQGELNGEELNGLNQVKHLFVLTLLVSWQRK